jgi:hypothetical protein
MKAMIEEDAMVRRVNSTIDSFGEGLFDYQDADIKRIVQTFIAENRNNLPFSTSQHPDNEGCYNLPACSFEQIDIQELL